MFGFFTGAITASVLFLSLGAGFINRGRAVVSLVGALAVLVRRIAFAKNPTEAAKHGIPPTPDEVAAAYTTLMAAGLPGTAAVLQNPSLPLSTSEIWPGTASSVAAYVNQALINFAFVTR